MEETIEIKRRDREEDVAVEPAEVEIKSVRRFTHTEDVEEFGVDIGAEKKHHDHDDLVFLFIKDDPRLHKCKLTKRNEVDNATVWGTLEEIRNKFKYFTSLYVDVSVEFGQPCALEFSEI